MNGLRTLQCCSEGARERLSQLRGDGYIAGAHDWLFALVEAGVSSLMEFHMQIGDYLSSKFEAGLPCCVFLNPNAASNVRLHAQVEVCLQRFLPSLSMCSLLAAYHFPY